MDEHLEIIATEVWKGHVALEIGISEKDLSSTVLPGSCFIFASRMSYLAVIAADVIDHLRSFAIELVPDVWFEYNGIPLKSNLPVGVLFDLFHPHAVRSSWKITVRFRDFPEDQILHCCSRENAEKHFMHNLKQALHSLHGSTRSFNAINTEDQSTVWECCNSGNRQGYECVAKDVRSCSKELVRSIPIRFLFVSGQAQVITVQKPCRVFVDEARSQVTTLKSILEQIAPSISLEDHEVVVQGIIIPIESPVYDLWLSLAHADFYLYAIVRGKAE